MSLAKIHIRVVAALIVREMSTRFGKKVGGYIWAVLDPAAHIFILTLLFSVIARVPPLGSNFALFFASGYLALYFWQSMNGQIAPSITSNRALLAYPVVAPIDVIIARFILQFLTAGFVAAVVIPICLYTNPQPVQFDYPTLIMAAMTAALLGLGTGMANIVFFRWSSLYEKIFGIVTRPMFLISGIFFLPDQIPQPYRDLLLINPIAHVVMWFRKGIYPYYRATDLDFVYLFFWVALLLLLGITLFTGARRTLRSAQ